MNDKRENGHRDSKIAQFIRDTNPFLLWVVVVAIAIAIMSVAGHIHNDRSQDALISAMQKQVSSLGGFTPAGDGMTWEVTALSGSGANNVVVQVVSRNPDGATYVGKLGITDSSGTAIGADWKAVSAPSPVNGGNAFIVWHDENGNFHCKVQ